LDNNDPTKIKKMLCTQCVAGGALAEPEPSTIEEDTQKIIKKEHEEKGERIKLRFEYVLFKERWFLEVNALLPENQHISFRFSKEDLEEWATGLKEQEEKEKNEGDSKGK